MKSSILAAKSKLFAIRTIKLYKYLVEEDREYVMSKQILRSGTSIGANVAEAFYAQSDLDFINKLSIARKEASETEYWLELLQETEYISDAMYESLRTDVTELLKLLTASIKTVKDKINL